MNKQEMTDYVEPVINIKHEVVLIKGVHHHDNKINVEVFACDFVDYRNHRRNMVREEMRLQKSIDIEIIFTYKENKNIEKYD